MINYPNINPDCLNIYGVTIKWYGVCHVLAFLLFYWRAMVSRPKYLSKDQLSDLLIYICIGVLFGGRVGYMVFYMPNEILADPLAVFKFWLPGRSFHGGLLGVIIGMYCYSKVQKQNFWEIADFIAPIVPLGIAFGRIGNFINGELWGRVTKVDWGMIFPHVDNSPRHPSQIYEFLLEGIILYISLNYILDLINLKYFNANYNNSKSSIVFKNIFNNKSAWFLVLYAIFRIVVENYREPDAQLGLMKGLSMGQILSIPMLLIGGFLLWLRCRKLITN